MTAQVLLLNASYEPLRIISTKRAICLILSDKAEVLEKSAGRFRSATTDLAAPSVIKLKKFVQIPFRATYPLNRRSLIARDSHECQVVGCERAGTTVDHLKPRSRGGRHTWTNVAMMCASHNFTKADRTLEEMGWKLKKEPRAPHGTFWLLIGLGIVEPDEAWEPYLAVA